jgi:hypothetical protein
MLFRPESDWIKAEDKLCEMRACTFVVSLDLRDRLRDRAVEERGNQILVFWGFGGGNSKLP